MGDRVGAIRRRRAITQEQLAEASGVSVETIRKLEQNERTSARIATLNKLARALGVRTSTLFGTSAPAGRQAEDEDIPLLALRRLLAPARGLGGVPIGELEPEPPRRGDVNEAIWAVDRAYHGDDYPTALNALPSLLADACVAFAEAPADARPEAARQLSQAYQLAGTLLIQLRRFDLAHRALDRALDAADTAGDRLVGAASVVSLCWLLLRQGRFDEAEQLAVQTADQIEPSFNHGQPEQTGDLGLADAAGGGRGRPQ
ncbi:helix-turn-helix transcriptional regulator [Micromonospora sp. NPDC049679]|uniref:helix-turn-helix domain-containing protein n=1 Tax=Micromonospora sp. NPDC049679 TaxID=3155920 RepID=UPI0033F99774